jgi:glutamyl/glutaminyl-tRNA synthetase
VLKLESSVIVMESILKKLNNLLIIKAAGKDFIFNGEDCKNILSELADELKEFQIKGKNLYMPIRSALTGKTHGPELPKVLTILGIETCISRIRQAINFISSAN